MIRAVIFDCFGVLASDGWLPFKERHFGRDPKLFQAASELSQQCDAGLKNYDGFIHDVAKLAGVSEQAVRQEVENNIPNEQLFGYIKTVLKLNYKIGMLSNAAANWLPEIFTPEQIALFDAVALSYEMGVIKPAAQSYQIAADRLGVQSGECVMVDDQERYYNGARDAGMQAVWYKDFVQFRAELGKILEEAE